MGVYNSLFIKCPHCNEEQEIQYTLGDNLCCLHYNKHTIPLKEAKLLVECEDTDQCTNCNEQFILKMNFINVIYTSKTQSNLITP